MAKARVVDIQFNDEEINFHNYKNHILAEGDSWFGWSHLNIKPSSNILRELDFRDSTVIVNLAYSGDVIRNFSDVSNNWHFHLEMDGEPYQAILLSGGGNDLIDALPTTSVQTGIIVPRSGDPNQAASYVNQVALTALTQSVVQGYKQIIAQRDASDSNSSTPIVLHTYDYPTPRNAPATIAGTPARGPWLLPACISAGVPPGLFADITKHIYDAMADTLVLNLSLPGQNVHVVDTRGTIEKAQPNTTKLSGDWINEIHPDAYGYALLAQKFSRVLAGLGIK